ncbi:unnamed protein product [Rhizoctonia solani]|uniref:Btz domain-containing protein n=1 Tax=Rhizoctonia solani TaxID=456999 RepID=A0A8H3I0J4_9AGAM|nr:unnamed protein product [Rhizoctonia solani]
MPVAKTSSRKPRHRRRTTHSSDESEHRRERSSSESSDSDSDTLSSSEEDALDTPVPPVSPRAKKHESIIPPQPASWSELVDEAEGAEPPIIDFADFVENGVPVDSSGPSHPAGRGRGRGGKRGKSHRQAYLDKLSEDPSFIPRVGAFWGHDERLLAPELRSMSDWWRGKRGRERGRGRGRGAASVSDRPPPEPQPNTPTERTWGHDGFEKLKERDQDRRTRGRGRGPSRATREPEQLWTKAPDTHLHIDPSTRPQFPGQGKGIKVNLPGQWRPEIVRVPRGQRPPPSRAVRSHPVEVPTEIVVKLPGKAPKVVATKEEPETVQPLEEPTPKPVARIPIPKTALPVQVLNQHARTRSQQDPVAFAHLRSPTVPAAPISFGSVDMPALNPGSAPPPETQPVTDETTPKIQPPSSAPLPSGPTPLAVPAPPTPPVANYYNPYAYTPLDGATYYSTATPPPPPHMYYPPNGFFVPPRPNASIAIRAPGHPSAREPAQDDRAHPPVWNYYPHPAGHNPYYSPSGTPYPGYYPEYGHGYEYPGGVYY